MAVIMAPLRAVFRALPPVRRLVAQRDQSRVAAAHERRRASEFEQQLIELRAEVSRSTSLAPVRDDLQYLFVVAYGRSGSTLVQGILSSIPGYTIRGENANAVYSLFKFHSRIEERRVKYTRPTGKLPKTDAWFGIDDYPTDRAIDEIRALCLSTVLRPEPTTRVVGFKEIRWWKPDWREYVQFLCKVFPNARFVINTRDHDHVALSKWWANMPAEKVRDELARYEGILDEFAAELGSERVYRLHYDDYVADPSILEGLFEWLGEPFDVERVRAVMSQKHSS